MPSVGRFNTTIVKSTALTHPDEVELAPSGVAGDRRYLILHEDGQRLSGAEKAPLLGIRVTADPADGSLTFVFPDGSTCWSAYDASEDEEVFPVRMYDRTITARKVFHTAVDHFLSEDLHEDLILVRVEEENARDVKAVTMISLATVEDLGRRAGPRWSGGMPDPRRFRMTMELDGCEPLEEDTWAGRRIGVGEAILRVGDPVPRCVITTLDPDTGRKDFPTLEVLATYRHVGTDLVMGVYADVERPGRVHVGEELSFLD
ncbi:MAG TPA: MOSC N-terminal beta barrel domain-containing protein [Actinomycetota bacterium]|nr:MOSC N-terminal beta barrel domain-containing protein [Actinomycetota bacterium]